MSLHIFQPSFISPAPTQVKSILDSETMSVSNDIDEVLQAVLAFLDAEIGRFTQPILQNPVPAAKLGDILDTLEAILSNSNVPSEFDQTTDADEATLDKITQFNTALALQWRSFVIRTGLVKVADTLLGRIRSNDHDEKSQTFKDFAVSTAHWDALNELLLLLDLLVALAGKETVFPSARSDFYHVLTIVVESLTALSSDILEVFWYALESRQTAISDSVFNPKTTLDRIAMLGICNGITDKYYRRGKTGKYDSYQKDTFNDKLHARVRTFLSGLLLFDDLTGLNKYFSIANRVNREPHLGMAKTGDDELLQDILQFYRLLRDPYAYLKNPRMLSKQVDSLDRLYGYLLDEEAKYAKKHPSRDIYKVKEDLLESKKASLSNKHKNAVFFSENYWLSPFEEIQRGQQFDSVKAEDQRVALKRFDSSKFRQLLLLQMYMVSSFFLELQSSRKRSTLVKAGAPASTKHVAEDSTPELLVKTFVKIKREIPSLIRAWDTQLSFLLQHISQSEEFWWSWLIWGKNKDGKPLLNETSISEEEANAAKQKFDAFAPYKTKRYFNTHATPQLSRKMRTKTGLSLLEDSDTDVQDYDHRIEELSERLTSELDTQVKLELEEERSVLLWKKAKTRRSAEWLLVSEVVDPDILGVEEEELPEENEVKDEKPSEVRDEEVNAANDEEAKELKGLESEGKAGEDKADPSQTLEKVKEPESKENSEPKRENIGNGEEKDEEMEDAEVQPEIASTTTHLAAKEDQAQNGETSQSRKRARSPEEDDSTKRAKTD